ncbi:MAG: 23S rRNA (adenine(2503)-C(2))-methyltransferase RlmN [Gemmataceae bacterium]|nr:23S rRNA (adenine(2503)-C(2))-methyltransferase RlmN [Gemmata sp.]MDW8197543.1 23S rRNA (adenine(2503)-C(2))-methyltransferase RlmN [Gemmataceae bacterium]
MTIHLPLVEELGREAQPLHSPFIKSLFEESTESLRAWLANQQQPALRAQQIWRQVFANRAITFEEMTDLPQALRAKLAQHYRIFATQVVQHLQARDDTHKLLLRLTDQRMIECVLIQDQGRATACISTQVGCGMGCVFCASGLNGVVRNLTVGEIVEQLVRLRNLTPRPGPRARTSVLTPHGPRAAPATRLTHIVVMGMGEPLANLDNLLSALAIAGDKNGLGIGARHVTISTVGLPEKIRQLAACGKPYHLAVSLHAPNDELRTQIVPTNAKIGLDAILSAADDYFAATGRQVTYEYVVLGGLNDQPQHARQLAGLLRGRKAHVNLIPWNEVEGLPFRRPVATDVKNLTLTLRKAGISVKIRKRKGADIDAACGQLRRRWEEKST